MSAGGISVQVEQPGDQAGVYAVNAAAFPDQAEATLVDTLRESIQPLVSLVAREDGAVVGHILFSPIIAECMPDTLIMGLAPMAVLPGKQRQGIGTALVKAGLQKCRELGAVAVVVLGHPEYYPRFGFETASSHGIACAYDVPDEAFMVIGLKPGYLQQLHGTLSYDKAFASVG